MRCSITFASLGGTMHRKRVLTLIALGYGIVRPK